MSRSGLLSFAVFPLALAACSPDIAALNGHPTRYYQESVSVVGQITRTQQVGDAVLLELADARAKRVLVRATAAADLQPSDWVKVKGLFVPEARAGTQTVYDVILADDVSKTSAPRFRNLF